MSYKIKTINNVSEIEQGELAEINIYNWGGSYRPKTTAKLCLVKDKGFAVKMVCEEKNPLVTVTTPTGHVCIDSCMEFFANFKPQEKNSPYINFEANAIGAMCCQFGEKGGLRPEFTDNNIELPLIKTFEKENEWGFEMFIPLSIIKKVYKNSEFKTDDVIRGNFFKCGDKTHTEHYGSYTKIDIDYPSFHQPSFFADMIISE